MDDNYDKMSLFLGILGFLFFIFVIFTCFYGLSLHDESWSKGHFCKNCDKIVVTCQGEFCKSCGDGNIKKVVFRRLNDSVWYKIWTWKDKKDEIKNSILKPKVKNDG